MVTLLTASGCASNPRARWFQQRAALTAAQNTLLDLVDHGHLTDSDTIRSLGLLCLAAEKALVEAEKFRDEGGSAFEDHLASAAAILRHLAGEMQARAPPEPPDPEDPP